MNYPYNNPNSYGQSMPDIVSTMSMHVQVQPFTTSLLTHTLVAAIMLAQQIVCTIKEFFNQYFSFIIILSKSMHLVLGKTNSPSAAQKPLHRPFDKTPCVCHPCSA